MILLRDLSAFTEREILLWVTPRRVMEVKDDQGRTFVTDTYLLGMSWYGWAVHRLFPELPYQIEEVISATTAKDAELVVNDKENTRPINLVLSQLTEEMKNPHVCDAIKQCIYEWQTKFNNFLKILSQGGEVSATASDVDALMSDPVIINIKERILTGEISVDEGELEFREYVIYGKTVKMTSFIMLARTGGVDLNQAFQMTVMRGAVFDLNDQILPNQINAAFAEGIVDPADALGENRGAGKGLLSNGKALEKSEWFHRKLHINTSVLMTFSDDNDCGSTRYVPVKILGTEHLRGMLGKYVYHEDKLQILTKQLATSFHKGDTLLQRSTGFCNHLHRGMVCKTCYGALAAAVPYNVIMEKYANIGMYSGTALAERIAQRMLSTKHFLRHTVAIPFVVDRRDSDVITTDGDYIFMKKEFLRPGTHLILDGALGSELADLKGLDSLSEINEDQLAVFQNVALEYNVPDPMVGGDTAMERTITTSVSSRSSRMSLELIDYLIRKGWSVEKKRLSVDLSEFNPEEPMFFLPYINEDLDQYRNQIESFYLFSNRNEAWMRREVTEEIFGEVLGEIWALINRKFAGINQIHSEMILTSVLTLNPQERLYRLPAGHETRFFSSFTKCIENRGMGGLYIYQSQNGVLENPATYSVKERQGGLMEAYMVPAT